MTFNPAIKVVGNPPHGTQDPRPSCFLPEARATGQLKASFVAAALRRATGDGASGAETMVRRGRSTPPKVELFCHCPRRGGSGSGVRVFPSKRNTASMSSLSAWPAGSSCICFQACRCVQPQRHCTHSARSRNANPSLRLSISQLSKRLLPSLSVIVLCVLRTPLLVPSAKFAGSRMIRNCRMITTWLKHLQRAFVMEVDGLLHRVERAAYQENGRWKTLLK